MILIGLGRAFIAGLAVHGFAAPAQEPPQVVSIRASSSEIRLFESAEISIELSKSYTNSFDQAEVQLAGEVSLPSGQKYSLPGYYEDKTRWKLRIASTEAGTMQVTVNVKDAAGEATANPIAIRVLDAPGQGFVRVSQSDPRYFELSSGQGFVPVGVNLPTAITGGMPKFEQWAKRLQTDLVNTVRVSLSPESATFALQNRKTGAAGIDTGGAQRLQDALSILERSGIRSILIIDAYNTLRDRDLEPKWASSIYNRDNGGPLDKPGDFWTNATIKLAYKNKLRYLVARYSAFKSVFAWELWNEVDLVRGHDPAVVMAWHDEMAGYLKSIDPYGHLVTTSFSSRIGDRNIDRLPQIDFTQTHIANVGDLAAESALLNSRKMSYGKPHIVTVVGAPAAMNDAKGMEVHDPIWSTIGIGSSGLAMPTNFDSYIEPRGMTKHLTRGVRFMRNVDWRNQKARQTTPSFAFLKKPASQFRRDLVIAGGPISNLRDEFNFPRRVRIYPTGVKWGLPVSGVLHGKRNRAGLHNPLTFVVDLHRPTMLDVEVGDVSGEGGAALVIQVDGRVVLRRHFADPDGAFGTAILKHHRSNHSALLPAGHHEVTVLNSGNDWLHANYRFRDLILRKTPPLIGFASVGDDIAVAWVRHADRSWRRTIEQKRAVVASPPTLMSLRGLESGTWSVEIWDTWSGSVSKPKNYLVGGDGTLNINLPEIATDLAVKIRRIKAANR